MEQNKETTVKTNPGYSDRTCPEANTLTFWGSNFFIIGIIVGVLYLVFAGFVVEFGGATVFKFDALASGVAPALLIAAAGYAIKILVQAFAIIVESHYRKLAPVEVKEPVEEDTKE